MCVDVKEKVFSQKRYSACGWQGGCTWVCMWWCDWKFFPTELLYNHNTTVLSALYKTWSCLTNITLNSILLHTMPCLLWPPHQKATLFCFVRLYNKWCYSIYNRKTLGNGLLTAPSTTSGGPMRNTDGWHRWKFEMTLVYIVKLTKWSDM